jgi:hypothetical protein
MAATGGRPLLQQGAGGATGAVPTTVGEHPLVLCRQPQVSARATTPRPAISLRNAIGSNSSPGAHDGNATRARQTGGIRSFNASYFQPRFDVFTDQ